MKVEIKSPGCPLTNFWNVMIYCKMVWRIQTVCVVTASPDSDSDRLQLLAKVVPYVLLFFLFYFLMKNWRQRDKSSFIS